MYIEKLKSISDEIEQLRLELYQNLNMDSENKDELDNILFSIQSKLRYDAVDIVNSYELSREE